MYSLLEIEAQHDILYISSEPCSFNVHKNNVNKMVILCYLCKSITDKVHEILLVLLFPNNESKKQYSLLYPAAKHQCNGAGNVLPAANCGHQ